MPKNNNKSKQSPEGKVLVAAGYRPIPVFGLEQTEPAPNVRIEKVYSPLDGETDETHEVIDGYKVAWWPWFESIRKELFKSWDLNEEQPNFTLAATLGAAIIAKMTNEPTELADLLQRLREYEPKEVAEYIDTAARGVELFLGVADKRDRQHPSTLDA